MGMSVIDNISRLNKKIHELEIAKEELRVAKEDIDIGFLREFCLMFADRNKTTRIKSKKIYSEYLMYIRGMNNAKYREHVDNVELINYDSYCKYFDVDGETMDDEKDVIKAKNIENLFIFLRGCEIAVKRRAGNVSNRYFVYDFMPIKDMPFEW